MSEDEKKDPIEEASRVAARWWREALAGPVRQNSGHGLHDLVGTIQAGERPGDPASALDAFETSLALVVANHLRSRGRCELDVDYGPDLLLFETWKTAGCRAAFPWKTYMIVKPGDVTVRSGYRAPVERLLGSARWEARAYRAPLSDEDFGESMDLYYGTDEVEARRAYAWGLAGLPEGGATRESEWSRKKPSILLKRDGTDVVEEEANRR